MGDNTFVLAADGWAHITPCGEFPHAGAGVVQVIDRAACDAIAAEFNVRKADANFPGVLVDFDHFSLDTGQSSEAAKRSALLWEFESLGVEEAGTRSVSRRDAETQRGEAAREIVLRELAERLESILLRSSRYGGHALNFHR